MYKGFSQPYRVSWHEGIAMERERVDAMDELEKSIKFLNDEQRRVYDMIISSYREKSKPIRAIISGGAGCGKTTLLKVIVETIAMDDNHILLTAPTGIAANLISGNTLHKTFLLARNDVLKPMSYLDIEEIKERRSLIFSTWLIIDEISMVSYEILKRIDEILRTVKETKRSFGGINVLLFGDIMQLPPVSKNKGTYCFKHSLQENNELWKSFDSYVLSINQRQSGNESEKFVKILNALRVGKLKRDHLNILKSRMLPEVGEFDKTNAVRIFPTRAQVNQFNIQMTSELSRKVKIYHIQAKDYLKDFSRDTSVPNDLLPKDEDDCGGLLQNLSIGVGSRVMLKKNLKTESGLYNGAMGTVVEIIVNDENEPSSIVVKFDNENIKENVYISRMSCEFLGEDGVTVIVRHMFPLMLCWSVTVHKVQGLTLDKAVIDLGPKNFAKGQLYVALSRVKNLNKILISNIYERALLFNPHDETCLKETTRLEEYNYLNVPKDKPAKSSSEESNSMSVKLYTSK